MPQQKIDAVLEHQYQQIKRWAKIAIHDNNNIINNILLALHQLKDEDNDLDDEVRQLCIKIIEDNIHKINTPFTALMQHDHNEEESFTIIEEIRVLRDDFLKKYQDSGLELLVVNKNIKLEKLRCSKHYFQFIYEELVSNAVQYAMPQSTITVDNEIVGDELHLSFQNLMPQDQIYERNNFVAFYSSKEKGIGLGLRKVKDIVQVMKGHFEWQIDDNQWQVRIRLPLETK